MGKTLSKVTIHLNDLTTVDLLDFPSSGDTMYEIVKEIRREGCFAYNGDTCIYVFPRSITKIVFIREESPEEESGPESIDEL